MRKEDLVKSLKVAATFLGTIIGAGFATGQEILKFFTVYRFDSYIGIAISTILFILLGIIILNIALKLRSVSYHDFLNNICGPKLGLAMDVMLTIFLFGTVNVMLSASGALFFEYFGLPYYFGIFIMLIPTIFIVIKGVKSILNVNFIVAPIMIGIVLLISIASISYHFDGDLIRNLYYEHDFKFMWLLSALLFVSYNTILSTPILIPIAREIQDKKVLNRGIIIGSLVMGGIILLLNTVILNNIDAISTKQIPLLYIIEPFNNIIKYAFIATLWLEIFTTIVSNMFGLSKRLEDALNMKYSSVVFLISFISIFISRFDFKMLLSILYPLFGIICLLFIVALIITKISNKVIFIFPNKNKI